MPPNRKRRASQAEPESAAASGASDSDFDRSGLGEEGASSLEDASNHEQMVKKMVRLALTSEYARQPIRRVDIVTKVLGTSSRQFKPVFADAQEKLRAVFGMEMVELPVKEKVTISQRRAAQRVDKVATASKVYVLTSVLPEQYRSDPRIIAPPKVPTSEQEATYVGIYTFLISVISLAGGTMGEAKLERYLKRVHADQYTPIEKTDKLLLRLCKEGYLMKIKDSSGGEEVVEYMVGPRGKIEVGVNGVTGLTKAVYGDVEDLESRVRRSMGIEEARTKKRKDRQGNDDGESRQNEGDDVSEDEASADGG